MTALYSRFLVFPECVGVPILRGLFTGLAVLALAVMLLLAINLKDPYLFAYRHYETPLLLLVSGALLLVFLLFSRGYRRLLLAGLATLVLAVTAWGECSFRQQKASVLAGGADTQRLGQHFIVGYQPLEEVLPLVRGGLVGGVYISQRNVRGKTLDELRREIASLQQARQAAGLPPLIVAADQEGGIVSHLSPPLERMPALSTLVEGIESAPERLAAAETQGWEQGRSLAEVGITLNLSPVVDLGLQGQPDQLDRLSRIGERAISDDPHKVSAVALAYVQGLQAAGVRGVLKHFPGLGRIDRDTHHFSAGVDVAREALEAHDWLPFREVVRNSDALLMLGHVTLDRVDREYPVSFSPLVARQIIREGWQHDGVLMTDDLNMRPAYRHGWCTIVLGALNGGIDLLLISYDYEQFYRARYCADQAYRKGLLDEEMLKASDARLQRLH